MSIVALSVIALVLVVAAILFLVAEIFLPTHGILAIASALCAIGAVVVAMWINPTLGMLCAIALLIVSPFAIYHLVKAYPSTPVGKRVMLSKPAADQTPVVDSALLGAAGKTITFLRPAGVVEINGKRVDCVSEGDVIDAGKNVTVVSLSNGRVVVRETAAATV